MTQLIAEIDPEERFPFPFDFADALALLAPQTEVTSVVVTSRMADDSPVIDPSPQNIVQGAVAVIGGTVGIQWIGDCKPRARYYLRGKAQASDGSIIVADGILPVKAG